MTLLFGVWGSNFEHSDFVLTCPCVWHGSMLGSRTSFKEYANSWIQLEKPFHHSATFELTTASQFPKSQQNPGSLTPIHRIIKSSFLTLTKNSYFQHMNGVQNSIPTPFSEEKIVQIMQILKFSHGLTHPCNKHLEFEAQKLRHHDHHVFIGRILPSWYGNRAWNYSKYTRTGKDL